jgi:hypothetical protein
MYNLKLTHTVPRANRRSTDTLVLGFISRFQMINPGKIQKVQSDQQLTAEKAYAVRHMIIGLIQLPFIPLYCPQK